LAVAGLLERAQHEIGEDALFGLAGNLRGELLVHVRRDGDVFWDFVLARISAAATTVAALKLAAFASCLEFANGEVAVAERVCEGCGDVFEFNNAARLGFFVDPVERGDTKVLDP